MVSGTLEFGSMIVTRTSYLKLFGTMILMQVGQKHKTFQTKIKLLELRVTLRIKAAILYIYRFYLEKQENKSSLASWRSLI